MPIPTLFGQNQVSGGGTGPDGNYQFHRSITIDHTKVPNTNQSDFRVLFSGTFTYLKTVGNGGNVENGNGFDIIFSSNEAGTSQLDHEIERYNASTGEFVAWVKVPSVLTATDTVFYIHYGNTSVSTSQENKHGVHSNNFQLAVHLPNGTTLNASDSTSNNTTPTIGSTVTAAAGQIDGAANFPQTGDGNRISWPDSAALSPTTAITVSLWFKRGGLGGTQVLVNKGDGAGNSDSSYEVIFNSSDELRFEINDGSGWRTAQSPDAISETTTWHMMHGTFDGSNVKIYVDGVLKTTTAFSGSINDDAQQLKLGELPNGTLKYNGLIDEFCVASVARSADWITTEFNNQSSPSTFYTVSGEL